MEDSKNKEFNVEKWRQIIVSQGERILIRPAKLEDKEFVWKAFQKLDADFYRYIGPISRQMVEFWYKKIDFSRSIPMDAFVLKDGDEDISHFVANATLNILGGSRTQHVGNIGLSVIPAYQRRGIATMLMEILIEIAKSIGLRRLELNVVKENTAAVRLYEKLRFEKEGILRKRHHVDGRDLDVYIMALLLA